MNATIKKQWVKALRSGKYRQGRFDLRQTNNRYCCLGVLCDIVHPDGWKPNTRQDVYEHNGVMDAPGKTVMRAAKLTPDDRDILIDANDDHDWTFDEIADYIEVML